MIKFLKKHLYVSVAIIIGIAAAFMAVVNPFYAADFYITDKLYTKFTGTSDDIIIVGVDEETLGEYGNFNLWSREKTAELLEYMSEDAVNMPKAVGLDYLFVDEYDSEADKRLVEAVAAYDGRVILGTNVVYRGAIVTDTNGRMYYDTENISDIEMPYDSLLSVCEIGFTNAEIAKDGCVRYAKYSVKVPKDLRDIYPKLTSEEHDSFAMALVRKAAQADGTDVYIPKTNSKGQFQFIYSGETGEFSHVSMRAVLAGEVPHEAFKDRIVLVGAYAPGFMDSYMPAIDKGNSMYGVEIHANIIQALMQHKTMLNVNRAILALVTFILALGFLLISKDKKLSLILIGSAVIALVYLLVCRSLANGIVGDRVYMPCLYFLLFLVLADAYFIVEKYVLERIRRKATLDVFKKYVAPEVVEELSKNGNFELKLGGEKRPVAVLFVDIRGFTPLSEGLNPEEVVAILNEYLELTTTSILRHKGTLDKFIGDATIAVFNAPFDLDDYIYEAVAAAWDIKAGSKELGDRLFEKFGKKVAFGVGVNCGEAVVGNIGCTFRMDYTAIGDTVNTAARLESNAKAEQILISESVYEVLKDRIEATPIGEIPLKGKSNKIMVYSVESISGKEEGNEV